MNSATLPPIAPARTNRTIRIGSLSFAASAQQNVEAAFGYLRDDDSYDPNTHTIHWDPYSALLTTTGGRQSPALGLGHEIDHAVENAWTADHLQSMFDPRYDSLEERRVITGSELHAARTLHESIRFDHAGSCYRVPSPIAR
jgi:hypothetical protein